MTPAKAAQLIEAHAYTLNPDSELFDAVAVALSKLVPKPRAARAKGCPVAARALKACSGIGTHVNEEASYLDTFGAPGSPEREAQRVRLHSLPTFAQFAYEGMPAKLAKDAPAARTFLAARMEQFERDDEAAREREAAQIAGAVGAFLQCAPRWAEAGSWEFRKRALEAEQAREVLAA